MKTIHQISRLVLSLFLANAAMAQDPSSPHDLKLEMVHNNQNAELHVTVGDEVLTLDPNEIAVGDTHTYTLPNTDPVNITRHETGWTLSIGDEEFELAEAHDIGRLRSLVTMADDVVIHGLDNLDESSQQMIRDAIRAAGVDKDIHFVARQKQGYHFTHGDGHFQVIHRSDAEGGAVWVTDGGAIQLEGQNGQQTKIRLHKDGDPAVEFKTKVLVIDKQDINNKRDQ